MIRSLRLINFKPFENQLLEFRPLTLLSGLNSSGKSSALQSLLLLRQSYQQGLLPRTGLGLNGDLVSIGTAQDALCERAKDDYIKFEVIWENNSKGIWNFNYELANKEADVLNIVSQTVDSEVYKSSLFNQQFHYLQAERIGPRPFNEMSDYQVRRRGQIGSRGEYTAHFLSVNERKPIPIYNLNDPLAKSMDLIDQVEGG